MKFVPIGELVYRVYVSVDNRSVDSDLIIVDVSSLRKQRPRCARLAQK